MAGAWEGPPLLKSLEHRVDLPQLANDMHLTGAGVSLSDPSVLLVFPEPVSLPLSLCRCFFVTVSAPACTGSFVLSAIFLLPPLL